MNSSEELEYMPASLSQEPRKLARLAADTRRHIAMRLVCWAFLLAGQFWTPTALTHFVAFVEASIEDERRRL
jgi:hypothetical protein